MKQEIRLLSIEEVRNLKRGKWVWVEVADSEAYPGGAFYYCELADDAETIEDPYTYTIVYFHSLGGCERFDTSQYGWRIWTGKPTKKLSKKTKWELI